ncbi:PQQ-binding-like beta-propeller repeat protein [Schlesneria sp. DSM 10557]|uniref:PQQ-like beta-propeller repeat protein n=1 Tax=Schlesneria sp. DSM 10557 TaxID=3044399 RepID=UPI0035A19D2B
MFYSRLALCALISVSFLAPAVLNAESEIQPSWPNWMGPNRDGISHETGWKTEWPDEGLPVNWSREIGIGFSSVSIAQGRLLTMGHVEGEEIVWCLDANTGEELWTHRYPCELNNNLHEGGPGATPTIDGERVYTLGKSGQLYCLNLKSGEVHWSVMLQDDLKVPNPEWGFSSSAVIEGNQVILEGGRVVSYDKITGAKNWETKPHEAGYGSAAVFRRDTETPLVATLDCAGLRITELMTGKAVAFKSWSSPFRTNATTPIIQGDLISISTAYNVGCGLFEWDAESSSLKEIYTNKEMRNHFNNSILLDGYLYGFDGNSNQGRVVQLTCMKFDTGKVAWKQRGMGCGSLMIVDGKLLILSESGTLILAKANPDGFEELAQSPMLTGRCWTVPVFLNKKVYGRNAAGKLVCLDLAP